MRGFINLIFLWVLAALIATHFVFFGHILLFAAAATPATGTSKVVFVGDSWAEFAEKVALPRVQVASRRRRGTRPPVRYRRRAEAVRAMILDQGVLEDRVDAKGMAGARRLCADTEDRRNNHKNRRVEIHCQ